MTDTKLDPRSLTSEERAFVDLLAAQRRRDGFPDDKCHEYAFEDARCMILARRVLFAEPASEPAKVECPNCGEMFDRRDGCLHGDDEGWFCKPVQPEPVAEEMPEAVHEAANYLRQEARYEVEGGLKRTVHGKQIRARVLNDAADALESFWRTHAAQPAKVRMTEELQRVLEAAETQAAYHTSFTGENPALECREIRAAIAAVRAQAAEAGKVRMPKVRELLDHLYTEIGFSNKIDVLTQAAFAALDAVEGKGEGRG